MTRVRSINSTASAWSVAVILGGCVVGPNYQPPRPVAPDAFTEGAVASAAAPPITPASRWWLLFHDLTLNSLEEEALRGAPDLASARARLVQARAARGIVAASQYPTLNADSEYLRTHGSANVPVGVMPGGLGLGSDGNLWQAGFDASWEVDFFGGVRRAVESADATYQAALEDRNDVTLTLLAEVARNYVELRSAQRQREVVLQHLDCEKQTLTLVSSLLEAGLASSLDELRARAQVADIESTIPIFEADEHAAAYRLAALIGRVPESMLHELTTPHPIPTAVLDLSAGLPSDLLRRRPDIRAAERRLAAANARIGVAQADLYPHFSLTGGAGLESLVSSTFFDGASHYLAVGPSLTWRIFDAGRVRSQVLEERARTDEAAVAYQRAVLIGLRDVETALVTYAQTAARHKQLITETSAELDAVNVATRLYKEGVVDFLSILDAQRTLQLGDDKLAQSERDVALAVVSVYKTLGGGWQLSNDAP